MELIGQIVNGPTLKLAGVNREQILARNYTKGYSGRLVNRGCTVVVISNKCSLWSFLQFAKSRLASLKITLR